MTTAPLLDDGPTIFTNQGERIQWLGRLYPLADLEELSAFFNDLTCRWCNRKVGVQSAVTGGIGKVACRACSYTMKNGATSIPHSWRADPTPQPAEEPTRKTEAEWEAQTQSEFEKRFQARAKAQLAQEPIHDIQAIPRVGLCGKLGCATHDPEHYVFE
jgi:hypothetical protein